MRLLFFLTSITFLITTGMALFFIYLRTELNYLSNDIILCGFVVDIPKFDFEMSLTPNKGRHPF